MAADVWCGVRERDTESNIILSSTSQSPDVTIEGHLIPWCLHRESTNSNTFLCIIVPVDAHVVYYSTIPSLCIYCYGMMCAVHASLSSCGNKLDKEIVWEGMGKDSQLTPPILLS